MAQQKMDFKKVDRDLYLPKQSPMRIDVPTMTMLMVDGQGEPGGTAYQAAIQALYSLTFTIKMSKMEGEQPEGYFEYVVPPLEGLWWSEGGALDWQAPRQTWRWTSMIRQPDFVTEQVFAWACARCKVKKPDVDISGVRLSRWTEGCCVQMMHVGPYATEQHSIEQMHQWMEENGYVDASGLTRKHHEIYLSDPRRTAPERLRTVLRLPVRMKGE